MEVIDKILEEWSYRCHDGIVDVNDPIKVSILNEILKEYDLIITEDKKTEYSNTLSVKELNKKGKEGDETRGDTVAKYIIRKIPFTLKSGNNKILDFIDSNIQNIFKTKNYSDLSKNQKVFVDEDDITYSLEDIVKTDAFGGKVKGRDIQHETSALNELSILIKNILQTNNLSSIKVIVGNENPLEIVGVENQAGNVKSDFNLITSKGVPVIFISHKANLGKEGKNFKRWGGYAFANNSPEVKTFIENIKKEVPSGVFENGMSFAQKISDTTLKNKIVFGKNFGEKYGIENVQIVIQGKVTLIPTEDNSTYILSGEKYWLNGDTPTGVYEPVLAANFAIDRSALEFQNCEAFSITEAQVSGNAKRFSSTESDGSWEAPASTRKPKEKSAIELSTLKDGDIKKLPFGLGIKSTNPDINLLQKKDIIEKLPTKIGDASYFIFKDKSIKPEDIIIKQIKENKEYDTI